MNTHKNNARTNNSRTNNNARANNNARNSLKNNNSQENNNSEYNTSEIPELGDIITIDSDLFTSTTGIIIYRDDKLIRIREYNGKTKPVDFNLDPATGLILDSFGVQKITIHKKRSDPHFAIQLGTTPGETLELYNISGELISSDNVVAEIIATDEEDEILLENGEKLIFDFIGPPDGIGIIIPHSSENYESLGEPAVESSNDENVVFPGFDANMLPAALVEEIPTSEVVFSDTIQRTDMFSTLFADVPISKQRDPKTLAALYRTSDLLLAMKNSVVFREENGAIVPGKIRSYAANTIEDIIQKQPVGYPVSAIVPVINVKKTVYLSVDDEIEEKGVTIKSDIQLLIDIINNINAFTNVKTITGNPFISYINQMFNITEPYQANSLNDDKILIDQDVIRTNLPADNVYGLSKGNIEVIAGASSTLNITNVKDRYIRVIASNIVKDNKTGMIYTVAEADTAETVGHILVDRALSNIRAPIRSSVLLWDIQASESRLKNDPFYEKLDNNITSQTILKDLKGNHKIAPELKQRLENDLILSIASQKMISVMDTLGLRNLEITPDILLTMKSIIHRGQNKWMQLYEIMKQSALEKLAEDSTYPVPAVTDNSELFNDEVLSDTTMQHIISKIQEKESLFSKYDLVYANDILKFAGATMGPLWYILGSNNEDKSLINSLRQTVLSEISREERRENVRRELAADFVASPIINSCPHVMELERLRSIGNDEKRMLILERFVKKYQAGQRDNYIICGTCNDNLICKHEMLLLNEFLHPGRGNVLHKELLLEFGAGVFEGAYICKACGQKIKDIEYDTHMEFDDDGRPLVGRAVIENNEDDEQDDVVLIANEDDDTIIFKDKTDKSIYKMARVIFERIGLHASDDVYKRVVSAARQFIEQRITPKDTYNEMRNNAVLAAKAGKRVQVPPEYKYYFADLNIGILGALILIEFQTSETVIPVPMVGVPFGRSGVPLDGLNPTAVGTIALNYVTFCIAGIPLDVSPWNETSWSAIQNTKKRLKFAQNAILTALYILLALQISDKRAPPPPLTDVTDKYKQILHKFKEYKNSQHLDDSSAVLASKSDHLPTIFRPLAFADAAVDLTDIAIGNIKRFEENVEKGDLSEVAPVVYKRSQKLMQHVMAKFHKSAAETAIILQNNPRSDSVCCYSRLAAIETRGVGVASLNMNNSEIQEINAHNNAIKSIKERDPAITAGGTHLYVPWTAPYLTTVLPTPSPDDYYKLFIKNCFRGRKYGLAHELDPNNVCRNCRFEYPAELLYPLGVDLPSDLSPKQRQKAIEDSIKEREMIAKTALSKEITITEELFRALEAQVRAQHKIIAPEPIIENEFIETLENVGKSQYMFMPDSLSAWNILINGFKEIQKSAGAAAAAHSNNARIMVLSNFAGLYDKLLMNMQKRITEIASNEEKKYVKEAFEGFITMTENSVGGIAPRNIAQAFVTIPEMIAHGYIINDPPTSKWFPSISTSHKELLRKIWENSMIIVSQGLDDMARWDKNKRSNIKTVLQRFSSWMSNWTTLWLNEIRPGKNVTSRELTLMLRWVVMTGFDLLLNPSSHIYNDISNSEMKNEFIKYLNRLILNTLVISAKRVKIYQLTQEQIDDELAIRAEKEKAYFIKKFDDLDQSERKVELIKKKLKIGDWSVGAKNLFKYDSEFFEFERNQRAAYGVPDFSSDVTGIGAGGGGAAEGYGFGSDAPVILDVEHDNMHYAADGDEQ